MRVQAPPQDQQTVIYERPRARPFQRKQREDGKCDHLTPGSDIHLSIETLATAQLNNGHEACEILNQNVLGQVLKTELHNPRHNFNACLQVQSSNQRNPLNHMGISALLAIVYDAWKKSHAKILDGTEKTVINFIIRLILTNQVDQDLLFRRLAKSNAKLEASTASSDRIPKRTKRQKAQAKAKAKKPRSPSPSLSGDDDDDDDLSPDDSYLKVDDEDDDDDDDTLDVEVVRTPVPKPKPKSKPKTTAEKGLKTPPPRKSLEADLKDAAARRAANREI